MKNRGFTIVELLIVIVVIAVLAAITVVAFNGIQDRAKASKVQADLSQLSKAMYGAKTLSGKNIVQLTTTATIAANNTGSGRGCWSKASGTDLATLAKTDKCWTDYYETLSILSSVSGVNVNGLLDPWGRPYFIDQTEGENVSGDFCRQDRISTYKLPHVGTIADTAIDSTYTLSIPNAGSGCQ